MKPASLLRILLTCATALIGNQTQAGLQIPYAPDANTLHLWHFDDPTNYVNSLNTVTDAVTTAGITLTNFGLGAGGNPPYTNIFLVTNGATASLKDCLNIPPADADTQPGRSHAFCGLGTLAANSFADTTPFRNPTSGAFTFEALVNIQGNIFSSTAGSGEWEIFCGDSSLASRSWQFRLQNAATPSINCNFINASGGSSISFTANLPASGLDAVATNQWYHVAVTYTGNAPTNGDPVGVLTFYWTLFDSNRTNASFLASFTNAAAGTLGGTPIPAIGGSARVNNGVGNAGSFQGYMDEVRVSAVARSPLDMVFTTNSVINPPTFVGGAQPPPSTFIGFGKPLSVPAVVLGTLPITYQWQKTNSTAGGWTNVPGQTANSYALASATFNDAGFYRLIATNSALTGNSITSTVAKVSIGAGFSELFNTGFNTNGVLDTSLAGTADPHFTLVQSADINNLGPSTIVWNMSAYPIAANGGAFANPNGASQWIGTQGNSYTSPNGQYVYRLTFLVDSVDLTQPVTLSGTWWENSLGNDILLNGRSTGNAGAAHSPLTGLGFTITNGFVPGLNTLDFVTTKDGNTGGGAYQESAVRVEMSSLGQALPAGLPAITNQPVSQSVRDNQNGSGSVATFAVVALGRPPLFYQWWADGAPVSGATNRTLTFNSPDSTANPGTNFTVIVSNASGSVTSSVAVLTLTTNHPPVVASYTLAVYSNTAVNFNLDTAYTAATDADGDPLTLTTYDTTTINGVGLTQVGTVLTYAPLPDYLGADQFSYTISDPYSSSQGFVNINVIPLLAPSAVRAVKSGNNLVLSGSGGSAGGGFHVLSSTNLVTPLASWIATGSGTFDGGGNFSVTNAIAPGVPQNYYIITVP